MQYIPCNSAILAQETRFLPKKALYMPKVFQKVCKSKSSLSIWLFLYPWNLYSTQKFHPRPIPRLFLRTIVFETGTETFFRPNIFETDTETLIETKIFETDTDTLKKLKKSLDTEKSRDAMSHS